MPKFNLFVDYRTYQNSVLSSTIYFYSMCKLKMPAYDRYRSEQMTVMIRF
jgi:hypothetical protein